MRDFENDESSLSPYERTVVANEKPCRRKQMSISREQYDCARHLSIASKLCLKTELAK